MKYLGDSTSSQCLLFLHIPQSAPRNVTQDSSLFLKSLCWEICRLTADFHFSLLTSRSTIPIASPAVRQNTCCPSPYLPATISSGSHRSSPPRFLPAHSLLYSSLHSSSPETHRPLWTGKQMGQWQIFPFLFFSLNPVTQFQPNLVGRSPDTPSPTCFSHLP